jgi:hypothetical protein
MAKIQRRERDQSSADRCSKVIFLRFAVIKEFLSTAGHDFMSRSDSFGSGKVTVAGKGIIIVVGQELHRFSSPHLLGHND